MVHSPLAGIRVLDLTNVLAGPFCCHQLAHMGAEVIKVEAPGRGDLARNLGADAALNAAGMGVSFLAQNAGKKSVTCNFKSEAGKALFLKLVMTADVVVENFRPGVMERLGLGHRVLRALRPELIYCAISGFGQDGPWVDRPAYDQIIQGVSGVMSVTGTKESGPLRAGFPLADTIGGLTAAMAIASALNARPRGTFIDCAMLHSVLATMGWVISNHLIAGAAPMAHGNENPTSAPSGAFQCKDGIVNIAANKDEQWVLLTDFLGCPELRARADYATREDRKANRTALRGALESVLAGHEAEPLVAALSKIGVPAGIVMDVPDILTHPQVTERGFLQSFDDVPGVDRPVEVASVGVQLDGDAPKVSQPPATLGQHNAEIWGAVGVDRAALETLIEEGAL